MFIAAVRRGTSGRCRTCALITTDASSAARPDPSAWLTSPDRLARGDRRSVLGPVPQAPHIQAVLRRGPDDAEPGQSPRPDCSVTRNETKLSAGHALEDWHVHERRQRLGLPCSVRGRGCGMTHERSRSKGSKGSPQRTGDGGRRATAEFVPRYHIQPPTRPVAGVVRSYRDHTLWAP